MSLPRGYVPAFLKNPLATCDFPVWEARTPYSPLDLPLKLILYVRKACKETRPSYRNWESPVFENRIIRTTCLGCTKRSILLAGFGVRFCSR